MTEPTSANSLSKRGRAYFGAGIGILIVWYVTTFKPDIVASWAKNEPGKSIFFIAQIVIFVTSIGAVITVTSLIAQMVNGVRLSKIKFKDLEVNFEAKKEQEATQDE